MAIGRAAFRAGGETDGRVGDWLFPHRGRELYSDKPPMLFWLQGISYEIIGSWRMAFLLPSLLAGLLTLGLHV